MKTRFFGFISLLLICQQKTKQLRKSINQPNYYWVHITYIILRNYKNINLNSKLILFWFWFQPISRMIIFNKIITMLNKFCRCIFKLKSNFFKKNYGKKLNKPNPFRVINFRFTENLNSIFSPALLLSSLLLF